MGYASKLGSSYNANTAWSSLGAGTFGGYGARDYSRAPSYTQAFRNILSVEEPQGNRVRPIQFNQSIPGGLFSFSSNPMEFSQELNQIPGMINVPFRMFDRLAGSYMNML